MRICIAVQVLRKHAFAFGMLIACLGLMASAGSQEPTTLSGTWTLDASRSDDPQTGLRNAASDEKKQVDGPLKRFARSIVVFGIPVGELPIPTGVPDTTDSSKAGDEWDYAAYLLEPVLDIQILQQDNATQLEYSDGTLMIYRHGTQTQLEAATISATPTRNGLVIEHLLDNGFMIDESYRVDDVNDRLVWTVSLKEKSAKKIEIVRVYTRLAGGDFEFA